MIDLNYLGHNFEEYDGLECADHRCNKCGIIIWFDNNPEPNSNWYEYNIIDDIWNIHINSGKGEMAGELKLTCDEYIIKNIVE